ESHDESGAAAGAAIDPEALILVDEADRDQDRKSTRLNYSHITISYAVFCLKKKICCSLTPFGILALGTRSHLFSEVHSFVRFCFFNSHRRPSSWGLPYSLLCR